MTGWRQVWTEKGAGRAGCLPPGKNSVASNPAQTFKRLSAKLCFMNAEHLFSLDLQGLLSRLGQIGGDSQNTASMNDLKSCMLGAIARLDTQSPRDSADGDPFGASGLRTSQ